MDLCHIQQTRKRKKGESETIYVGLDIHKRKSNSAIMDEQGRILDVTAFINTKEGLACLIEHIKRYGDGKAVLESTGNFWLKSYETLKVPESFAFEAYVLLW